MATKNEIATQISEMDEKVLDTMMGLPRGVIADVMKIVGPMMRDQLELMHKILNMKE